MTVKKKALNRFLGLVIGLFVLMNIVAFFHAYRFTHFSEQGIEKTRNPRELGLATKIKVLLLGIDNPKPVNHEQPARPFETVHLQSSKRIECWHIKVDSSKGTVIIFHGFSGNKARMLDKSEVFNQLGYSTFLVDFIGTGGSEGNETTIGYKEAQDVKVCLDYVRQTNEKTSCFWNFDGRGSHFKSLRSISDQPGQCHYRMPFWIDVSDNLRTI
ncbi:MAG: hypothetical protein IPL27_27365 [Lewinellaceae bacterium]|nr:hypothetical protein [Lewinellaceae bacterium]